MGLADHLLRGRRAEASAEKLIRREKYEILDRNLSFPCGEIDLIARQQDTIVFVEVRSRANALFGRSEETVNAQKQRKLVAAAQLWLQQNDPAGKYNCRFDVIGYTGDEVQWIKNAFDYR